MISSPCLAFFEIPAKEGFALKDTNSSAWAGEGVQQKQNVFSTS